MICCSSTTTSDDHNVRGTDNHDHVEKCYSYSPSAINILWKYSKNAAMEYSFLTGMHFFSPWILTKLGNFGKRRLWQSQNHIFLEDLCPEKKLPWLTARTSHAIQNTISYTASWPNNPNLRAEYKQLCNKVVSQLQNAKQSHALTSCNPVYKLAGTIASYALNQAAASKCTYTTSHAQQQCIY